MRVLLSTIGSRGDVQPLVALATRLRMAGLEARLCVPPDFRDWIESLGFPVTPIGPQLRAAGASEPRRARPAPPSPEQLRQLAEASVADQFTTISAAAEGCDVIVAATALQIAARSVAETLGTGYVFAAFCPAVLPSPHHAPPPLTAPGQEVSPTAVDHLEELWARDAARFNVMFGPALNRHRASAGLPSVDDVRSHVFTARPWLAADPVLGPWPGPVGVFQTGAWLLPDDRPLPAGLEAFLHADEPPVYFGFGSMLMAPGLEQVIIAATRAAGRRAIISSGWAELALACDEPDCLVIGEANQQRLFQHVAAVVHHGGAGTTIAAALAGAPQVVIPQIYDQHYWARQVRDLGIGTAHAPGVPTAQSLTAALRHALQPDVAGRARSIAPAIRRDGASTAAENVRTIVGSA
jgi:vancomycin aglycone glucosyltransferase